MAKQIIILANSRKLSGRCVAGKDHEGQWIRITKGGHEPIPVSEAINYPIGSVIEVSGLVNTPSRTYNFHTENSIYNRTRYIGNFRRDLIDRFLDHPDDIFGEGRVLDEEEAQELDYSLLFVEVQNLRLYYRNYGQYGYKLRGDFEYNGITYTDISVTDSDTEARFANHRYPYSETYDRAYITISLGEIFNGGSYKLISGIIIP
jgi:hypothetical protein